MIRGEWDALVGRSAGEGMIEDQEYELFQARSIVAELEGQEDPLVSEEIRIFSEAERRIGDLRMSLSTLYRAQYRVT